MSHYVDLDCRIRLGSHRQQIRNNFLGSGNMSRCRTLSLENHLDLCFIVSIQIQRKFLTNRIDVWRNWINLVHNIDESSVCWCTWFWWRETMDFSVEYGSYLCFQKRQKSDFHKSNAWTPSDVNHFDSFSSNWRSSQAWSRHFVDWLIRLVCQLTISLDTFLSMTFHLIRPWRNPKNLRIWQFFSHLPRKFSIQTWLCNCPQYLRLFGIVFECVPRNMIKEWWWFSKSDFSV